MYTSIFVDLEKTLPNASSNFWAAVSRSDIWCIKSSMVIFSSQKTGIGLELENPGKTHDLSHFDSFCVYGFFGQPGLLNQESAKGRPPATFASDRHRHPRIGPQQRQKLGPEGRPPKSLGSNRIHHWWLRDVSSSVYSGVRGNSSMFVESSSPILGEG